mmetsp:Transcript_73312/g.130049  ORF Transcript_73312/g.130049 Transcript_73312/m.130049 type:complete len:537 (+) Transcript_73312:30-1640(+)
MFRRNLLPGMNFDWRETLSKALSKILRYEESPAFRRDGFAKLGYVVRKLDFQPFGEQREPVAAVLEVVNWSINDRGQPRFQLVRIFDGDPDVWIRARQKRTNALPLHADLPGIELTIQDVRTLIASIEEGNVDERWRQLPGDVEDHRLRRHRSHRDRRDRDYHQERRYDRQDRGRDLLPALAFSSRASSQPRVTPPPQRRDGDEFLHGGVANPHAGSSSSATRAYGGHLQDTQSQAPSSARTALPDEPVVQMQGIAKWDFDGSSYGAEYLSCSKAEPLFKLCCAEEEDQQGWILVENSDKRRGWFPMEFFSGCQQGASNTAETQGVSRSGSSRDGDAGREAQDEEFRRNDARASSVAETDACSLEVNSASRVINDYTPHRPNAGYLTLTSGQAVHISYIGRGQGEEGWLFGNLIIDGPCQQGWFPEEALRPVAVEAARQPEVQEADAQTTSSNANEPGTRSQEQPGTAAGAAAAGADVGVPSFSASPATESPWLNLSHPGNTVAPVGNGRGRGAHVITPNFQQRALQIHSPPQIRV